MKTELQKLQDQYSDMYKEEYGFRPRATEEQWNDIEWLKAQIKDLSH